MIAQKFKHIGPTVSIQLCFGLGDIDATLLTEYKAAQPVIYWEQCEYIGLKYIFSSN